MNIEKYNHPYDMNIEKYNHPYDMNIEKYKEYAVLISNIACIFFAHVSDISSCSGVSPCSVKRNMTGVEVAEKRCG